MTSSAAQVTDAGVGGPGRPATAPGTCWRACLSRIAIPGRAGYGGRGFRRSASCPGPVLAGDRRGWSWPCCRGSRRSMWRPGRRPKPPTASTSAICGYSFILTNLDVSTPERRWSPALVPAPHHGATHRVTPGIGPDEYGRLRCRSSEWRWCGFGMIWCMRWCGGFTAEVGHEPVSRAGLGCRRDRRAE